MVNGGARWWPLWLMVVQRWHWSKQMGRAIAKGRSDGGLVGKEMVEESRENKVKVGVDG